MPLPSRRTRYTRLEAPASPFAPERDSLALSVRYSFVGREFRRESDFKICFGSVLLLGDAVTGDA